MFRVKFLWHLHRVSYVYTIQYRTDYYTTDRITHIRIVLVYNLVNKLVTIFKTRRTLLDNDVVNVYPAVVVPDSARICRIWDRDGSGPGFPIANIVSDQDQVFQYDCYSQILNKNSCAVMPF